MAIWQQLRADIARQIEDGPLSPGDALPSETALAAAHGIEVWRDDRRFSAVPATPDDAAWLEAPVGAPLLLLRGTNSDTRGRTVAHIVHRIRGDRAEYGVRVPR